MFQFAAENVNLQRRNVLGQQRTLTRGSGRHMPVWEKYRPFVTQYAKVELTRNRNIIQRGQLNGLCFKHKRKALKEIEAVSPRANRFNNQQLLCIFADRTLKCQAEMK